MANSKAQAALNVIVGIGPKASAYTGPTVAVTGTTTSGSASVTSVTPTTGVANGMSVTGTGIAAGSTILSGAGTATWTLSKNATATGSGVALTVSVFVAVGELSESPVTGNKWDNEDVTSYDSGNNKEFLKTLKDSGKVALKLNRVSTNNGQVLLKAAFLDTVPYMFQESFPMNVDQTVAGDSVVYAALVNGYDDSVQIGKAIKISCELQRTGTPTETAGS